MTCHIWYNYHKLDTFVGQKLDDVKFLLSFAFCCFFFAIFGSSVHASHRQIQAPQKLLLPVNICQNCIFVKTTVIGLMCGDLLSHAQQDCITYNNLTEEFKFPRGTCSARACRPRAKNARGAACIFLEQVNQSLNLQRMVLRRKKEFDQTSNIF